MADEDLVRARELLAKYAAEAQCGWCKRQAAKLATAATELQAASPGAMKFHDEVQQTTELSHIDEVVGELKSARDRQEEFKQRLSDVLDRTRELEPRTPPPPTLEDRSRALPRPRLPAGFVTPDELGRKREEEYARYKENVQRKRGPVRDHLAFRAWSLMERSEQRPLRRNQT